MVLCQEVSLSSFLIRYFVVFEEKSLILSESIDKLGQDHRYHDRKADAQSTVNRRARPLTKSLPKNYSYE